MTNRIYESRDFGGSRVRIRHWPDGPMPRVTLTVIGDTGTNATVELSYDECINLRRALMSSAHLLQPQEVRS